MSELTTAENIIKDLEQALKEFGEYTYYDKGPDEVMEYGYHGQMLVEMPLEKASAILKEVNEHKHGGPLATALVGYFDNSSMSEEAFWDLLEKTGVDY